VRMKKAPTEESPSPAIRTPRPRKRREGSRKHVHQEDKSGFIALSEENTRTLEVRSYSGFAPRIRGAKIRNSKRWISGISQPVTALDFPFIDRLGRFTGSTLFKWSCDPKSFVASVVSTILNRLIIRARHYNDQRLVDSCSDKLVRAAFYYAISKNNYFWDRILFFVKNLKENRKLIQTFVSRHILKTDAHKRFVYGHACNQAQWLLFRAERPRDKSAIMRRALPLLSFERSESALLKMGGIVADIAKAMSALIPTQCFG
jgi:hypothetical protein